MIVMSTSSHVAPPKVTIASRPQTAAAAATGGVTAHMSGSEVPVPVLLTTPPQQPFENGRRNNPSKKLPTPVLVSTHVNSSLFATPTRPPPPSVRPKSSSVSATTAIKRSVPATPAQSAIASPRSRASLSAERAQESSFKRASATPALSSSAADTTGNIYHAMVARKSAEDTATQLARRIAHFRAQEERVLREVQDVKSKLESALLAAHQQQTSASAQHQGGLWPAISSPQRRSLQSWTENSGGRCASNTQSRREPKAPRNREQLQFLTVSSACAFLCGGRYATVQLVWTNPDSLCFMARAEAEESVPDAESRVC